METWIIIWLVGVIVSVLLTSWLFADDIKSGLKVTWSIVLIMLELSLLSWLHVVVMLASAAFGLGDKDVMGRRD